MFLIQYPVSVQVLKNSGMKIQPFVVNLICFILFLYFLIPIAIEYFSYASITTTYQPHFSNAFPKPKLYLHAINGPLNDSTLEEVIRINKLKIRLEKISDNDSMSTYRIQTLGQIPPTEKYRIWWRVKEMGWRYTFYQPLATNTYSLSIRYDFSDDVIFANFRTEYGKFFSISVQIFGTIQPPYENAIVSNASKSAKLRVRYNVNIVAIDNNFAPEILLHNLLSMMHEPISKYSFPNFLILIFGMIGLFSDITALNLFDEFLSTVTNKAISLVNQQKKDIPIYFIKIKKILIFAILFILCSFHIYHTTCSYNTYDIQSAMYEGPPISKQNQVRVKICVQHFAHRWGHRSNKLDQARNMFTLKVQDRSISGECKSQYPFNMSTCIELSSQDICNMGNVSCMTSQSEYFIFFEWKMIEWISNVHSELKKLSSMFYMASSIFPTSNDISCWPQFGSIKYGAGTFDHRLLYVRAEYMKHPYITKCRDIANIGNRCMNQRVNLQCLEEVYMRHKDIRYPSDSDNELFIAFNIRYGIDIKVSSSMTMFDYISCVSTITGFWLGLCILGVTTIFYYSLLLLYLEENLDEYR